MSTDALILELLRLRAPDAGIDPGAEGLYNTGIGRAIAIIRAHDAERHSVRKGGLLERIGVVTPKGYGPLGQCDVDRGEAERQPYEEICGFDDVPVEQHERAQEIICPSGHKFKLNPTGATWCPECYPKPAPPQDTVERVARALHNTNFHPSDHGTKQVEEFWRKERIKYIQKAKAAIAAMGNADTSNSRGDLNASDALNVRDFADGWQASKTLFEKLESAKFAAPVHPRGVGFNEGLECAANIIRKHVTSPEALGARDALKPNPKPLIGKR